MSSKRVALVGPSLAGRRESLSALARHYGESAPPVFGNEDRLLSVGDRHLTAFVACKRSLIADASHPEVKEELKRVTRSSGFIFVVDSQRERLDAAHHQLNTLREDLLSAGLNLDDLPVVFQMNKRDLPGAVPLGALISEFSTRKSAHVESVATRESGVLEALQTLIALGGPGF